MANKIKTHSGAKKRFQVTGTGKVKFQHAYKRHRLVSKDRKVKRIARNAGVAGSANALADASHEDVDEDPKTAETKEAKAPAAEEKTEQEA